MAIPRYTPTTQGDTRVGWDEINRATGLPWRALRPYEPGPGGDFGFDPASEHPEPGPDGKMYVVPGAFEQTSGGGFLNGGLAGVARDVASDFKAGNLSGLSIPAMAAGVNLGVGSGFLPTPDSLASLAASGPVPADPAFWDNATASAGTSDTGYGAGRVASPDTFTMNTGANPNNIFTTSPSSLGELSATPGTQSMYDLAGASGVPNTGIAAIDAPGQVVNLAGGGMIPAGVDPSIWQKAKEWLQNGKSAADVGRIFGLGEAATRALGAIAPAALGAVASSQQAAAYKDIADKYLAIGAPSRGRYESSFQPGFSMANEPGYKDALAQTTKETLNRLSPGGNPAGSPNAWNQTLTDVNTKLALPQLNEYRRINAGAGGLATLTGTAPTFDAGAVKARGDIYNSIGAGAADVFNPRRTLADLLKEARVSP